MLGVTPESIVAIHNKNGKGLLLELIAKIACAVAKSQSTIKMEKGYYTNKRNFKRYWRLVVAIHNKNGKGLLLVTSFRLSDSGFVAIHNKNGKGLLPIVRFLCISV